MTEALSLPREESEPTRRFVGEVLNVRPAVRRVSRRVAFRGYDMDIVREIDSAGQPVSVTTVFKPTKQYDPGIFTQPRALRP